MSAKDAHLYGIPRPKKSTGKEISSSSSLAFTSELSSLIAAKDPSDRKKTSAGRQRPKKEDIFAKHNKGSRKRALKDLEEDDSGAFAQKHSTSSEQLDDATWRRAKRKMEEKARLYAAMKRGDLDDDEDKLMVDFDRKWAEREARGEEANDETSSDDGNDSEPESLVEYMDEFGRTRKGTRMEAAREERRRRLDAEEGDQFTARPSMPTNIIFGDTIQKHSFNPDENIAAQMAELASKRDKDPTPPPDTHFDGHAEIRNKGTGFYHFSADGETRKKEMEALEAERKETERRRAEKDRRKDERRKLVEERRKAIGEKRGKARADKFLDTLGDVLGPAAQDEAD
jgi:hypothetical protein